MANPVRILVIEDTEEDLLLLLRELKRAGYEPSWRRVWTPEDIEAALEEPWDIAISDWSMPRLTGLDAFRIVQARAPFLPFIIVSGTIGEEIAVDALKAGVDDFMVKGRFARLAPAIERARRDAAARREQRDLAERLARKREQIERSERLLRVVLDSVPDGVIVADDSGEVLAWNPAASVLLGVSPGLDQIGDLYDQCAVFLPDHVTPIPQNRRPLMAALRGEIVERQELCVRTPDGAARYLSISAHPLKEHLGRMSAISVFRDVTRERTAQEQLMISDRMASIGMLAAGVAHEINNPLAAVLANLDLVANELVELPPGTRNVHDIGEMIADARTAADRVRHIVRDLRIFSRHDEAQVGAVDVRQMLDSTLRMAWNELRHRARLIKDFGDTPRVRGTESRLGQVFLNLVINAAQAIPAGNVEGNTIRIVTRKADPDRVLIEVIDSGGGMSTETRQHLFTPFFTTKAPGEGTGLGLAIVHRIVTGLGGTIEVESELGRGTTFRILLPIALEEPARPTIASLEAPATRRGRIFVIDDEQLITMAVRRLLSADHDVESANRAADALERLRAGESFDVILCDLMMPQMTGMDLYVELEQLGIADRMIFLTGGAFTPAARQFLDRIPNQRVEKPFDGRHLRALIRDRIK